MLSRVVCTASAPREDTAKACPPGPHAFAVARRGSLFLPGTRESMAHGDLRLALGLGRIDPLFEFETERFAWAISEKFLKFLL